MYVNNIENRITFKIQTEYYLELITTETMNLLESTKNKMTKDKNDKNVGYLETTEVVSIYCNISDNDYQHDSRVLYTFIPNNTFGQLLDISPKNLIFLKTFNMEFSFIEVWFIDYNPKALEIEGKINISLVIN